MKFKSYYWVIIAAATVAVLVIFVPLLVSRGSEPKTNPHTPEELAQLAPKVDYTAQIQAYNDLISANPQDVVAIVGLGEILAEGGRFPESADQFRKAIEIDPNDPLNYARLGDAYFSMNMIDLALREFDKGLAIDPNNQVVHLEIGLVSAQTGKLDDAIKSWQRAYDINPNNRYGRMAQQLLTSPQQVQGTTTTPAE